MPTPNRAASQAIVPFWNRLPKVMAYPAHGSAMASIVLLGLAEVLWLVPIVGWILAILAAVAMYRYAFECLQATADGFMVPPEVTQSADRSLGWKYIVLLVILALVMGFGMALLGPVVGIALVIFLGISLPGATMTLAMEESLSEALNPLKWIAIFVAIGWPYLAVVGLYLTILGSEGFARNLVGHLLPLPVALIAIGIISNYALVMTFHLMGYMLYQYHEALGLTPAAPEIDRPAVNADPDQALLDEASALVRDGKIEEATEKLRVRLRAGASPAVHAQYRKLLRVSDNKLALLEHGNARIVKLVEQDDDKAAVELLRECQAILPSFSPESAMEVTKLAYMASRQHQPKAAVLLMQGFEQRFPKSQYLAQCGLLEAEILHEQMSRDEDACAILRHLKATIPKDPLMPEIDARLQVIERMIAATSKPKGA